MRQYNNPSQPPAHSYSTGNPKPSSIRPNSNMRGGPGGYPTGMQNSFDTADLSSASIESELKRIETYLNTDSTSYFKNMGITFSKPGKVKEKGGFDTASFNTKETSYNTDMFRTPTKMPPLFEVNSESQNREMYESEGQPNSMADSDDYGQDNAIIEQAIQRINERSHPFYKELHSKFDNQQEHINNMIDHRGSFPSNNHESEEMDRIFGGEKTSPILNRNRSNSRYSNGGGHSIPRFTASSIQTTADRTNNTQQTKGEQYNNNYYDAEESVDNSSPSHFKAREIQPLRQESFPDFRLAVKIDQARRPQSLTQSLPNEPPQSEVQDVDYFLKHLMVPRRMKISIDGVPFQEVIFVLALKFFEKSAFFENFVFEWLDVKSTGMIGYIKCDYIKYVYKQGQKRFNIACRDPRGSETGEELLHYVHIEADTPEKCDLYVNGLTTVMKYMEKSTRNPMNKGM